MKTTLEPVARMAYMSKMRAEFCQSHVLKILDKDGKF